MNTTVMYLQKHLARKNVWLLPVWVALCCLVMAGNSSIIAAQTVRDDDHKAIIDETTFYDIIPLGACGDPTDEAAMNGTDNVSMAFNYFVSKGFTAQQAAGILGNFLEESGMNPKTHQDHKKLGDYPVNGVGFGIAQWTLGGKTSGRQGGLVKLAASKSPAVLPNTLPVQLEYVWQEFNSSFKNALQSLKAASTPSDAAFVFHRDYEISNDTRAQIQERLDSAETIFKRYGSVTGTPVTAADSCVDDVGAGTGACDVIVNKNEITVGKMQGTAAILSCARLFDPYGYLFGGAHGIPSVWMKKWASQGGFANKSPRNIVDCSSIVMLGIYLAFGVDTQFTTDSIGGHKHFKRISFAEVKPGDIMVRVGHMEIATNKKGTKTFGAHTSNTTLAKQISDSGGQDWTSAYRYTGPGATATQ